MIKKIFSLVPALLMLVSVFILPVSAQEKLLTFGEDGTFRIMQINDFQDVDMPHADSLVFLNAALDKYQPDLVVLVGDQLSNYFPGITVEKIKTAISKQVMPMQERGIPFIFTFGNHDWDHHGVLSMEDQAAFYREFSCCYANADGADGGTYSTLIYDKSGTTPLLNVYMMDTGHWNGSGWICGVTQEQVQWYESISSSIKEMNGGVVVPALVFQHIPVKEIMQLTKVVPAGTPGAVKNKFYDEYLVLDEDADWIGDRNVMREAPASEHPEKVTGQYEAWLSQGDVMGAYFGHDHINTFAGKTADGIALGYNGGFGFATYGDPGERYAKIYDFNENDVKNYTQQTIYYTECVPQEAPEEPAEPEPEKNPADNCSCNCHKKGISNFFWKIANFFNKLFKIKSKQFCACGVAHY